MSRVYLSPPHLTDREERLVVDAIRSGWVAPVGPHLDAFERAVAERVGVPHTLALSSGTAALHLALRVLGVGRGDRVVVPTFTFAGSAFPVTYDGGEPVFVDAEPRSWNLSPDRLEEALDTLEAEGTPAAAVIVVHLYGQAADMDRIAAICEAHGVAMIEDAAEALGTTYRDRHVGQFGDAAILSFNGNKIITASSGGMLMSRDADLVQRARKLSTQAREPVAHYEHREIGYNYRMSNILAALGGAQLETLDERIEARRRNFAYYRSALSDVAGLSFMPETGWGLHTRWLTTLTLDAEVFGADREAVRLALEGEDIESRAVWKPMHLQPVFQGARTFGGEVAEDLFERGLCLPSGSDLTGETLDRIVEVIRRVAGRGPSA